MQPQFCYFCRLPVIIRITAKSHRSIIRHNLNVAASKNTEAFTFNRKVTSQTKTFAVKLSYPAGDDVKVSLKVDASLTSEYNAKNDTHYEVLPETYYQLLKTEVVIPAGKTTSEEVGIKFSKLDELEIDVTLPLPAFHWRSRWSGSNGRFAHDVLFGTPFQCHYYGNELKEYLCCCARVR